MKLYARTFFLLLAFASVGCEPTHEDLIEELGQEARAQLARIEVVADAARALPSPAPTPALTDRPTLDFAPRVHLSEPNPANNAQLVLLDELSDPGSSAFRERPAPSSAAPHYKSRTPTKSATATPGTAGARRPINWWSTATCETRRRRRSPRGCGMSYT